MSVAKVNATSIPFVEAPPRETPMKEKLQQESRLLSDKRALVTGATQGIGLAIANELASSGCSVIIHGIEEEDIGAAIAKQVSERAQVETAYIKADLTATADASALIAKAEATLGPLDILVNNAGVQFTSPVEYFPLEKWNAILSLNLTAAFLLMQSVVPSMRHRGWGRIINIASVHGLVGSPNKSAYVAAKHGLVGISKAIALETAAQGITVNCICPGFTDTPILIPQIKERALMLGVSYDKGMQEVLREKQPNLTLLPPSAIGTTAVFLCSDAASGITGVALPVDGGWTAQ